MANRKKTNKHGYIEGKSNGNHSSLSHRKVAYEEIYRKNRSKYPGRFRDYIVHHIDHDKRHNAVANLALLTKEEHDMAHTFPACDDYDEFKHQMKLARKTAAKKPNTDLFTPKQEPNVEVISSNRKAPKAPPKQRRKIPPRLTEAGERNNKEFNINTDSIGPYLLVGSLFLAMIGLIFATSDFLVNPEVETEVSSLYGEEYLALYEKLAVGLTAKEVSDIASNLGFEILETDEPSVVYVSKYSSDIETLILYMDADFFEIYAGGYLPRDALIIGYQLKSSNADFIFEGTLEIASEERSFEDYLELYESIEIGSTAKDTYNLVNDNEGLKITEISTVPEAVYLEFDILDEFYIVVHHLGNFYEEINGVNTPTDATVIAVSFSTAEGNYGFRDSSGDFSCNVNKYDCEDFDTQQEANDMLVMCATFNEPDIHYLDGDDNGVACESLP
jgi:hypothetical protein